MLNDSTKPARSNSNKVATSCARITPVAAKQPYCELAAVHLLCCTHCRQSTHKPRPWTPTHNVLG
jgi:hypothetical protein